MSSEYERNVGQLLAEKRAAVEEMAKNLGENRLKIAALKQ